MTQCWAIFEPITFPTTSYASRGLTICYLEVVKIMLHEILQIITKVDLELILEPVGLSLGNVTDGVGFEYRGCRFSDNPFSSVVPRHNPHRQREKSISEKENYMVKKWFYDIRGYTDRGSLSSI